MARLAIPSSRWLAPLLAGLLLALPLVAGAELYTWKDKNGRTVMSDKPPMGQVQQKRTIATPSTPDNAPPQKTFAEKEMDFRKQQQDAQDKAKKEQAAQAQEKARKESCESAKRNLAMLQSGQRLAQMDDKGERYFLDDNQRAQETAKAQKAVSEWCK